MMRGRSQRASVAIVGGGLAGLATAAALSQYDIDVVLFEARRRLGGRAASFDDPESGEQVDHCQHVTMGCCTNLADFARRVGIDHWFVRYDTLHFIGPDGRRYDFRAARGWPAPLHLLPPLLRLGYLSWSERLGIARAMIRLARQQPDSTDRTGASESIGHWLERHGQSQRAIRRFWEVVLVSALGESLDRASLRYARQVFVEGFMAARDAYLVDVPRVPLGTLYGQRLHDWLTSHGVDIRLQTPIVRLRLDPDGAYVLPRGSHEPQRFDAVVAAVDWRTLPRLFDSDHSPRVRAVAQAKHIDSSPITGVHLWFDRPITTLPHAVLIDRLSQWLFRPDAASFAAQNQAAHYHQVVISASRTVCSQSNREVVDAVVAELRAIWPEAAAAKLLKWRVVTEPHAVFSATPDIDALRPDQKSDLPRLMLAGDWTATAWPSTMEGAVRSGYLAAEAVLCYFGQPSRIVRPSLPRGRLARWLLGSEPA